jgi:hypothetical protein
MNPLDQNRIDKLKLRIIALEEAFTLFDRDNCTPEEADRARQTVYGGTRHNWPERIAPESATSGENISDRTWPDNLIQNPEN